MSPLFACSSCGVQIERSARSYLQQRARVLCSTCLDKLDKPNDLRTGAAGERDQAQKPDNGRKEPPRDSERSRFGPGLPSPAG